MRRLLGSLIRLATIPMNRLKILPYTANFGNPKDIVNVELMKAQDDIIKADDNASIAALMARMGLVIIPTNIALTNFPNPIVVNGRNYTLTSKQRVLLTNQTTSSENGVYEVSGTNLVRLNDYEALDGIFFNSNQIGVKRWNNVLNAARFNANGELQVRIKNSGQVGGQDVFTGWQVEPTTGELYTLFNSLPGANGSVTIEDFLGAILGIASKLRFSKDFKLTWDGANTRANVEINPNRASLPQVGGYMEAFENPNIAISEPIATTPAIIRLNGLSNSLGSASWQQIYADKVVNAGRLTSNPNSPFGGVLGYYSPQFFRVVTNFNHYTKSRLRVTTFANNHQIAVLGYFENLFSFGNTPSNAVYFRGKPNENSVRWQCICSNAGVPTTVNLGASYPVLGSAFKNFEIRIINSQALFYIDDTLVATITTNLPSASTSLALAVGLAKTTTQTATAGDVMDVGHVGYATEII